MRSYVFVDFFNRICTWDVLHVTQLCTIYKQRTTVKNSNFKELKRLKNLNF